MLREPDDAFPQKCIHKTWVRAINMPLPGFISYYLWIYWQGVLIALRWHAYSTCRAWNLNLWYLGGGLQRLFVFFKQSPRTVVSFLVRKWRLLIVSRFVRASRWRKCAMCSARPAWKKKSDVWNTQYMPVAFSTTGLISTPFISRVAPCVSSLGYVTFVFLMHARKKNVSNGVLQRKAHRILYFLRTDRNHESVRIRQLIWN